MGRRVQRQRMAGRTISPVGRDVHETADGFAELLEYERRQRNRAGHVAGKRAQRLRLVNVGVDQFPEREVIRQLERERDVPRRNLVEIAGQPVRLPL